MNFNFYIFGNPDGKYDQYPQDYSEDFIAPLCSDTLSTCAVIYRHMDLVHYIYKESLGDGKYIGVCMIFNHVRAACPKNLFAFLRTIIEDKALNNRKFIEYSPAGDIVFNRQNFCDDVKAYDYLKSLVNASLDNKNDFNIEVLPTKYSGANETVYTTSSKADEAIVKLSDECNKVVIESSYSIEENHTNQIISALKEEIGELNQTIADLEKRKKQYRKVIVLFLLVLCCCGGLYFLYDSLYRTKNDLSRTTQELADANDTITNNRNTISNLTDNITSLQSRLNDAVRQKEQAESSLAKIQSSASLIITGCSFSFGSGEYTCNYSSTESHYKLLKFKVIHESSGRTYSRDIEIYLYKGNDSFTVYLGNNLNSSNYYTFEIWDNNRLIGGSRH